MSCTLPLSEVHPTHVGEKIQALMEEAAIIVIMDDDVMRIAVGLRLGVPLCRPHQCFNCGTDIDVLGTHGLSCRYSKGRHSRHAAVNDIIKLSLESAKVPCHLEPVGLYRSDGKRPDGASIVPWKAGKILVWDVTCPDTLAPSHLSVAVREAGAVAVDAEYRKELKYSHLDATHCFIPIAVETLGAFGTHACTFFREVARRVRLVTDDPLAHQFLVQRISVAGRFRGVMQSVLLYLLYFIVYFSVYFSVYLLYISLYIYCIFLCIFIVYFSVYLLCISLYISLYIYCILDCINYYIILL